MEQPNVLVLGPGGDKGTAIIGALKYLESTGKLSNISVVAGVSVGSIIGLLWVCGYTLEEIFTESMSKNMIDMSNLMASADMFKRQGIFNQKSIEERLTHLVKNKFGIVPTLEQLYNVTGKEFMTVVSNTRVSLIHPIARPEYFSYKTQPYLLCVKAVLMSCNIPVLFGKTEYKDGIYTDGALTNPYPVDQYDKEGNRIIGISVIGVPVSGGESMFDYVTQSMNSPITQLRTVIQRYASSRVCNIDILLSMEPTLNQHVLMQQKHAYYKTGFETAKAVMDAPSGKYMDSEPIFD